MTTQGKGKKPGSQSKKNSLKAGTLHTAENLADQTFFSRWAPPGLLIVSAIVIFYTRIRLLAIPLERDEAGFAYIGHWLLKGKSLYVDMVDNKLPGLYMLYGLFTSMFGYHASGVHIGLLLSNLISAVCFFLLLRELYNRFIALVGTSFLIVLLASPNIFGFAAHATQLLLPFALGGWLFFWRGIRTETRIHFLLAGLLLGIAFVIKQQSIIYGLLAALIWWPLRLSWVKTSTGKLPWMEYMLLGVGGLLPVALVIAWFTMTGRFNELFFWAYEQPASLAAMFGNSRLDMFQNIFPAIMRHFESMWLVACAGLIVFFMSGLKKGAVWFGMLFALSGLLSVIVGTAFYQHYFTLVMPGVALLAAISLHWISGKAGKQGIVISVAAAFILLIVPLAGLRNYYFNPDFDAIHQRYYRQNMFPEIEKIGEELSRRMMDGDRIGVLGSEPGILVAADKEGCSKHLFMYPLLSDPETSPSLQEEYKNEIKKCFPEYIVWNTATGSWANGYNKILMFKQLMEWTEKHYVTVGMAEFRKDAPGVIVWDEALQGFQSQSQFKVYVFKKK